MYQRYQDVLAEVNNSGDSLSRSAFFKWRWIVEMNMVDPGYYSLLSQQLKTDKLSAACKKELLDGPSHQAALHKRMDRQVLPFQ